MYLFSLMLKRPKEVIILISAEESKHKIVKFGIQAEASFMSHNLPP